MESTKNASLIRDIITFRSLFRSFCPKRFLDLNYRRTGHKKLRGWAISNACGGGLQYGHLYRKLIKTDITDQKCSNYLFMHISSSWFLRASFWNTFSENLYQSIGTNRNADLSQHIVDGQLQTASGLIPSPVIQTTVFCNLPLLLDTVVICSKGNRGQSGETSGSFNSYSCRMLQSRRWTLN